MTTNTQMKNINEYFATFLNKVAEVTDSGENVDINDLISYWNDEENQKEFAKLIKTKAKALLRRSAAEVRAVGREEEEEVAARAPANLTPPLL